MDRREALKKLAIGGALAAGGSIVLSSNNVAFAQSGIIPPPTAMPVTVTATGKNGAGVIQLSAPPAPTGTTGATYEWRILGCKVPTGRTLVIINSSNNQVIARGLNGGCSPIPVSSGAIKNAPTVLIRTVAGGSTSAKELSPGDSVSLKLIVKWTIGNNVVEGRYNIGGVYPSITVTAG